MNLDAAELAHIESIQNKILAEFKIDQKDFRQVFYSRNALRIKEDYYLIISSNKKFSEVKFDIKSFKTQDLIKISKLVKDLYYVSPRKSVIYTLDEEFVLWCAITDGHINSIRLAV